MSSSGCLPVYSLPVQQPIWLQARISQCRRAGAIFKSWKSWLDMIYKSIKELKLKASVDLHLYLLSIKETISKELKFPFNHLFDSAAFSKQLIEWFRATTTLSSGIFLSYPRLYILYIWTYVLAFVFYYLVFLQLLLTVCVRFAQKVKSASNAWLFFFSIFFFHFSFENFFMHVNGKAH